MQITLFDKSSFSFLLKVPRYHIPLAAWNVKQ